MTDSKRNWGQLDAFEDDSLNSSRMTSIHGVIFKESVRPLWELNEPSRKTICLSNFATAFSNAPVIDERADGNFVSWIFQIENREMNCYCLSNRIEKASQGWEQVNQNFGEMKMFQAKAVNVWQLTGLFGKTCGLSWASRKISAIGRHIRNDSIRISVMFKGELWRMR